VDLEIVRYAYLPKIATLGFLQAANLKLDTIEEAWSPDPDGPGGQRREANLVESCVPDGRYRLIPHDGPTKKDVWALVNEKLGVYAPGTRPAGQAWGRDAILIHVGNTTKDIMGCIAVGLRAGWDANQPHVYDSQAAINILRNMLGRDEHSLIIRPSRGTNESP
jgi:hypothetical protein